MTILRVILHDQLSLSISSLEGANQHTDIIVMCEVIEECTYVKHHKKKIAFLLSAMRHFSKELEGNGFTVHYVKLDAQENSGTIEDEIVKAASQFKPEKLIVTEPSEWRLMEKFQTLKKTLGFPVEIRPDERFLASHDYFNKWASGKKQLRMEFFYREMRKKYDILIEKDAKPTGGEWNYDKENRHPPKEGMVLPRRISHKKSDILKDVLKLVCEKFDHHFGTLNPFHYAVTRDQALIELRDFIDHILPYFGDYQDAMVAGEPYLYHSLLSSYLNAGLLLPLEICKMAEDAYRDGQAPLNAVEGFIRQILGWREYVRGIYWLHMPSYGELNYFEAKTPLPEFYWNAQTNMFCMSEAIKHTRDHAYSHHIQRLMVTGNFALLAGLDVKEVQEWYLSVYSDAFEWVEMPNTLGMALFGDGGLMSSKPYAASGKYIHKMSNYCQKCSYDPEIAIGEKACPFNALYWDFFARHEDKLRGNQRIPYVFSTWDKFDPEKQKSLRKKAQEVLTNLNHL